MAINKNTPTNLIAVSGKLNSGKDTVGQIIQYLTNIFDRHMKTEFNLDEDYSVGSKFEIKKFADKLKDIVCLLLNCTREQLKDREFKEKELGEEWWKWHITFEGNHEGYIDYKGNENHYEEQDMIDSHLIKLTPKLLLQLMGTECGRQIIHPNIWINALMSEYFTKKYSVGIDKYGNQTIVDKYPNWIITDMRFPNELKAVKDRGSITIKVNRPYQTVVGQGNGNWATFSNWQFHPSETALDDAEFDYVINNNSTIEDLTEQVKKILIKEKLI